jgi:hypothetical protein
MKKYYAIFLLIICFSTFRLAAQELHPIMSAEKDTILIGDQINLKIQLKANPETKIAWPRLEEFLVPKVEILNRSAVDSLWHENGELELQQNLIITSFDTGYYEIPGLEFTYQNPGEEDFLKSKSNGLDLYVLTIVVDTTQAIMPIKGPISSPYTWQEIAPWLLLGLVIIGMIIFLIYYFKRRSKQEPVFKLKSKPKIPAHIVALSELEELKTKKLWQEGKFKAYYTELIDIIRVYLGDQFGIDAMEMTSDEINQMVAGEKKIDKKIQEKLSEALSVSDLVKFAKEKPLANVNDVNLDNLIDFVKITHEIKEEKMDESANDEANEGLSKAEKS